MKKGDARAMPRDAWRIEDDLRAVKTAIEVKSDPKRMAAVQKLADKQMESLSKIKSTSKKGK